MSPPSKTSSSLGHGPTFGPGLRSRTGDRAAVAQSFHQLVSPPPSPDQGFLLVASFDRSSERGFCESPPILHWWLFFQGFQCFTSFRDGCFGSPFLEKMLAFSSIESRTSCKSFSHLIFLWGNGGPNWIKEYERWGLEKEAEWIPPKSVDPYFQAPLLSFGL